MKFPVTREILQSFDPKKYEEEKIEEQIQEILQRYLGNICKEFEKKISQFYSEKKYIWRQLNSLTFEINNIIRPKTPDIYINLFIEKLQEQFNRCDIIVDPLKTYIIIDWS